MWYNVTMTPPRPGTIVGDSLLGTDTNRNFGALARAALQQILSEVCIRDFNGTVGLTLLVSKGTIQEIRKVSDQRLRGFTNALEEMVAGGNHRPVDTGTEGEPVSSD